MQTCELLSGKPNIQAKEALDSREVPTRPYSDGTGMNIYSFLLLSLLWVLVLAPKGFSPGTPVFPSP